MADDEDDISRLAGAEPAEIDLSDETQDFRFLDKLRYIPPRMKSSKTPNQALAPAQTALLPSQSAV